MMMIFYKSARNNRTLWRSFTSSSSSSTTTTMLELKDIPTPPSDRFKMKNDQNLPTHVEYFSKYGSKRMTDLYMDVYNRCGDIARLGFPGSGGFVVIFDPAIMLDVHRKLGPTPIGATLSLWPFIKVYEKLEKEGVVNMPMAFEKDVSKWKRVRHALQKGLFNKEDSKRYVPLLNPVVKDAVDLLPVFESKHFTNIHDYLNHVTFEMIHQVALGYRPFVLDKTKTSKEDLDFVLATTSIIEVGADLTVSSGGFIIKDFETFPKYFQVLMKALSKVEPFFPEQLKGKLPIPNFDAYQKMEDGIRQVIEIAKKKIERVNPNASQVSHIAILKQERELDTKDIAVNVIGLLQGGVDTTANTILWLLLRLAENPNEQEILRNSIMRRIQDSKPRDYQWTAEDLEEIPELDYVIEETMRFQGTAAGTTRFTTEEITITSNKTNLTYKIPSGTRVSFSHNPMRLDKSIVSEADKFKPERHSRECRHARKGTKEAVIDHPVSDVFSFGPRICLGARIAKIELKLFIAEAVSRFRISLAEPAPKEGFVTESTLLTRPYPRPKFKFDEVQ